MGMGVSGVGVGQTSVVVACKDCTVAFGPSPTGGELGYGEDVKSSTKPKAVDDLDMCTPLSVAMGIGASLVLLDTSSGSAQAAQAIKLMAEGFITVHAPAEPGGVANEIEIDMP